MRASVFPSTLLLLLCGIATAQLSTTPTPDVSPIRQLHEKPCLGEITRPWKNHIIAPLGWNPDSLVTEAITAYEDSILVVDSWHHKACARFFVFVNSRRVAKTERSSASSDEDCKDCIKTGDYIEAYITLPKGTYVVDIRYAPKENCGTAALGYPKVQLHNQCKKKKI